MNFTFKKYEKDIYTGMHVRHRGELKVVLRKYNDSNGNFIVEFVDRTKCINAEGLELDGRK